MIQYNSLRKKGFNFRIDKKLMKKKILLKLKQCILSLRKAYNNQKELIIDFLKLMIVRKKWKLYKFMTS